MRPAGPLREKVYIEKRGVMGDDGYGNVVEGWEKIRPETFAANIRPMRNDESSISGANEGTQNWEITLRWHSLTKDLCHAHRVINARTGETFNVLGEADYTQKRRSIKLTCVSGRADG